MRISCKAGQAIELINSKGQKIVLYILKTGGRYTRIGVDAPTDVVILRKAEDPALQQKEVKNVGSVETSRKPN